jgi:tetratricopeptide (TPR) repeat protein
LRNLFYIAFIAIFAIVGCEKQKEKKQATPSRDFQAGEYYDYYGASDSAFYFYNRVINNSRDSLEKGTAYFKMGLRQLEAGDYYAAQESLLSSIKTLDEKNKTHYSNISADYNTLANATLELKDYESAIRNYNLAFKFAPDGDPKLYILNNLGVAYQKKGEYSKAISVLNSAVEQKTADTSLKAMLISNLARTKWLDDPNFIAQRNFMAALTLRRAIKDSAGMNASFAFLSDYYTNSRRDSALYYAVKRFEMAQRLGDPSNKLQALSQLGKLSPPDETKQYLEQYIKLDDSLSNVRSRDRNQYVLIKFDAEKSKADNLILQKHVIRQRLIIWGTVLFAMLLILGLVLVARARRKRLKRDAENSIRESSLKTSQKVHDVVANGLYRIMNELEHRETIAREPLLNKIEELYEKSRDISYEQLPQDSEEYDQQIYLLVTSFANGQTNIFIAGNEKAFWNKLSSSQKRELKLVLEEVLVNMRKHSRAKNVVFRFREQNGTGYISYKDDGLGFSPGLKFGNGLNNTVNRIKSINGQINFGESSKDGVSILVSFPLTSFNND